MKTKEPPKLLPMEAFLEKFKRARNAGTPIFAINCFDPAATMSRIQSSVFGDLDKDDEDASPIIQWDIIEGWRHRNKAGQGAIEHALKETEAAFHHTAP